ncbi:MAG: sugar phosphate isomerase/epimerase [Lentisphaerae bacterium]|nr:sugar phosphate isomerase/epimerase [Lentisphaerota bacterium]
MSDNRIFSPDIGVLTMMKRGKNVFLPAAEYGLKTVQMQNWDMSQLTEEMAEQVKQDLKDSGIRLAAFWAGYTGRIVWNFRCGPSTCGLVPRDQRSRRVAELKKGAEFAAMIGAPAIITHCGFIPESPVDPLYGETLSAIWEVAAYCRDLGLGFWFETGQETPATLLRTIEDLHLPNLGINLDTANLILYGRGNPVDALDVFGPYVRNLHVKDGIFPVNGNFLGKEVPVGEGKANFPEIIRKLKELNFSGEMIIEREISGPQQAEDIKRAVSYLKNILDSCNQPNQ